MKISSRKKHPETSHEVTIEIDLNDLDDDTIPVAEPQQEEFEFYKEDWVIQGAIKMGYHVTHFTHQEVFAFSIGGPRDIYFMCTELALQSDPEQVKRQLSDTMDQYLSSSK